MIRILFLITLVYTYTLSGAVPAGTLLLSAGSPFPSGSAPNTMAVGDFNGDGKLDIAVVNYNPKGGTVTLLFGNGSGGFTPGGAVAVGDAPTQVVTADFNGDGRLDLAVVNYNSNNISVLLGDGRGKFSPAPGSPISVSSTSLISIAAADFNRDGRIDLVVGDPFGGLNVLLGNGTGAFTIAAGSPFSAGNGPASIAVADFNGDGKPDLAIANVYGSLIQGPGAPFYQNGTTVTVMLGNGAGGFTPVAGSPFFAGQNPVWVTTGDFNGDGKPDLAVACSMSNSVAILLNNGFGGFTPAPKSPIGVGKNPTAVVAADLNGDGSPDLAISTSDVVFVLLNNGSGSFGPVTGGPGTFAEAATSIVAADFNGDGRMDLATATPFSTGGGGIFVLLGATTPTLTAISTTAPTTNILPGATLPVRAQVGSDIEHFADLTGTVTFQDGVNKLATVPLTVGIAAFDITTLAVGPHSITATYSGDARSNPSTSSGLLVTVGPPPPPPIQISGVANGASFQPGVAAPNTILSLFGSNLTCAPKPVVMVGGASAEVLAFANSQINFVAPPGVPAGSVPLQVVCGTNQSQSYPVPAAVAAPALFTAAANGVGQASILNQNFSLNSTGSPAARGDYISVFGTGFGVYSLPDANGLQWLAQPVTVFFGDIATSVQFAGAAPGYTTGLQQINVQIPANAPAGPAVPIRMGIGTATTPSGVTVAIQ